MANDRPWEVTANAATSLKAAPDTTGYMLRLGIAVTAIRAAHRLTVAVEDIQGPSASGTRIWAFLLAIAYLHETGVTAQSRYSKLKEFALAGGATQELLDAVGQTFAGKTDVGRAMVRLRNQLVFHFDSDTAQAWIKEYDKKAVVWIEGLGPKTGNTLHRASMDVVSSSILPDIAGEGVSQFRKLLNDTINETEQVLQLLEHAITGYLNSVGAELKYTDGDAAEQ